MTLTGSYERGFEAFGFVPDPDEDGLPVAFTVQQWFGSPLTLEFTEAVARQHAVWPSIPLFNRYSCYEVRFHGTLTGPGPHPPTTLSYNPQLWNSDTIRASNPKPDTTHDVIYLDALPMENSVHAGNGIATRRPWVLSAYSYLFVVDSVLSITAANRNRCLSTAVR